MNLSASPQFFIRSVLGLLMLSSLACIVTTDELANSEANGFSPDGSGGTGGNTAATGGTGGTSAGTGGNMVSGTGASGATVEPLPGAGDMGGDMTGDMGGDMTGDMGGSEACSPGGMGYQSEDDHVIALDTCVYYQSFSAAATDLNFAAATAECESLTIGGFNDWRLPSQEELSAIVDPEVGLSPSIDSAIFPNTAPKLHWTNLQDATTKKVTTLDFGNVGNVSTNTGPDGPQAYRCVRAAAAL